MRLESGEPEYGVGDELAGRYQLRRDLGSGGSGHVFEAVHRFTGSSVAIKLIAADVPRSLRSEVAARLEREARALAGLRHPNIVQALDGGILSDGTPYLVMELLEGRTLEGLLAARGCFGLDDTVAVAWQLCDALEAAHAAGIVHRDVKPSNVVIVRDHRDAEVVKLLDFGTVRVAGAEAKKLTSAGALVGTPAYMSPEQLLALDDIDERSDVYALGITLFECLTGRIPYEGNYPQVLLQVCSGASMPDVLPRQSDVPDALVSVVRRAMLPERADRFHGVGALRDALRAAVPRARRQTSLFAHSPSVEAPGHDQRRRLPRAPYVTPVRFVMGERVIDARTEDISTGGVLVICRHQLPVGSRGVLRLALPIEGTIIGAEVVARWVRAARDQDPEGPRAVGFEFVDVPTHVVASLEKYVGLMCPERG